MVKSLSPAVVKSIVDTFLKNIDSDSHVLIAPDRPLDELGSMVVVEPRSRSGFTGRFAVDIYCKVDEHAGQWDVPKDLDWNMWDQLGSDPKFKVWLESIGFGSPVYAKVDLKYSSHRPTSLFVVSHSHCMVIDVIHFEKKPKADTYLYNRNNVLLGK